LEKVEPLVFKHNFDKVQQIFVTSGTVHLDHWKIIKCTITAYTAEKLIQYIDIAQHKLMMTSVDVIKMLAYRGVPGKRNASFKFTRFKSG